METAGLSPRSCRVVEVAVILLDPDCRVVDEMVSMVSRERLAPSRRAPSQGVPT
jgi:oligoribonuclease (3'-5' exoribonuclease)